jgi:hypothetical protein
VEPDEFLAGHPVAEATYKVVRAALEALGPVTVRASKSQIAFRRRRNFAFLWLPGQYLARPAADVVLSIALGRHDGSPRFKEVVHPASRHWLHHLEISDPAEVDGEVVAWLQEAAERSG